MASPTRPRPKRRPSWTRASKLTLHQHGIDRHDLSNYKDQHGRIWGQAQVMRNVELGSMKMVQRRRTKQGCTLTVLFRPI